MKFLSKTLLFSLMAGFIAACTGDLVPPETTDPLLPEESSSAYVMKTVGDQVIFENLMIPDEDLSGSDDADAAHKRFRNRFANGNFSSFGPSGGAIFQGSVNGSGPHGGGEITLGGSPAPTLRFKVETVCISREQSNAATYGGIITEILENTFPPLPPGVDIPWDLGNKVYFRVVDNGQGSTATGPDQLYGAVVFSASAMGGCAKTYDFASTVLIDLDNPGDRVEVRRNP